MPKGNLIESPTSWKPRVYVAKEDDIIELAINMMDWKNIRSIPVENPKNELVGIITARELLKYHTMSDSNKPVFG